MQQYFLVETTTQDKLIHQGIFLKPKRPQKIALLWVHGLGGNFYSHLKLFGAFAHACTSHNFGFAAFNNRGHHLISGVRKFDRRKSSGYTHVNGGAGYENFLESTFDIEAGVQFLVNMGFQEVVIIGHSTGANKVCYYGSGKPNLQVSGIILASPLSDRLDTAINKQKLVQDLQTMQRLSDDGQGEKLVFGYHFFPMTPKRFLSLFTPNSLEDQFDYGDPRPRMKYFSKITKPLLVLVGSRDEALDRSPNKFLEVFDTYQHSTHYKSAIIKGAPHNYSGKETEMVQLIVEWAKSIC